MCAGSPDKGGWGRQVVGGGKHTLKTEINENRKVLWCSLHKYYVIYLRSSIVLMAESHYELLLIKRPLPVQTLTPLFVSCSQRR